jgi:hypothetical protein
MNLNKQNKYVVINDAALCLLLSYKKHNLEAFLGYSEATQINIPIDLCFYKPQFFRESISTYRHGYFSSFELYAIQQTLESILKIGLRNKWIRSCKQSESEINNPAFIESIITELNL